MNAWYKALAIYYKYEPHSLSLFVEMLFTSKLF